jgi:hypothetical protein
LFPGAVAVACKYSQFAAERKSSSAPAAVVV